MHYEACMHRGAGTTLKLRGANVSRIQGNPYPKLKTPWICPTIFWRGPSSLQKQTKIKINAIDSPKLGGGALTAYKLWGQVAPTPPPPPAPASLCMYFACNSAHDCQWGSADAEIHVSIRNLFLHSCLEGPVPYLDLTLVTFRTHFHLQTPH